MFFCLFVCFTTTLPCNLTGKPTKQAESKEAGPRSYKVGNKSKYFNFKITFPLNALQALDLPSRELDLFLVHRVRRPFFANC